MEIVRMAGERKFVKSLPLGCVWYKSELAGPIKQKAADVSALK